MPDANSAIEHFSNSVEYVLFTEGWISLRVGEQEYFLETEDALCNNASLSHCYINNLIGYTRSADFHLNQPFGRVASAQIGMKECRQAVAFLVE